MTKTIKIRYLSDKVSELEYIDGKSDWIDLRVSEDVEMKQGDFKLIPLGIAIQLPTGYEAHMVPRSSTYKNFGIIQSNHMGVVDETYCGDNDQWYFPAIAMRDTVIHAGDRICQFRIMEHQPQLSFVTVDTLGNKDRGGIGSTGRGCTDGQLRPTGTSFEQFVDEGSDLLIAEHPEFLGSLH